MTKRYRIKTNVTLYDEHIDIVDSIGSVTRAAGIRDIIERYDRVQASLRDCVRAAAGEQWTYIVEGDPTTLPPDSFREDEPVGLYLYHAAWTDSADDRRIGKSSFEGGTWYYFGYGADLADRGWRVYAWRPWPTAPPTQDGDE